ncbi:hypothetical protein [Fundidesulfovibrio agrisoli]|uniref:hypothetical protein n=1 Tax=Fundidesulfovibrio agrisoli TaxID=2922717 RepID=UPI001FADD239|nr:hypothetical protein [Fundidesulfovibrio agrisoli]
MQMPSRELLITMLGKDKALELMRSCGGQRIPEPPGEGPCLRDRIVALHLKGHSNGEIRAILGCSMRWVQSAVSQQVN